MQLINIIHLCAILETGNEIHRFHSALITRERNKLEIISRTRKSFPIFLLLLSYRDGSEIVFVQIDNIESVASLDANDTTIDDQFFRSLLHIALVMRYLWRELSGDADLLPLNVVNFDAFITIRFFESALSQEINVEFPHVPEGALFKVLTTVHIDSITIFTLVILLIVPNEGKVVGASARDLSTHEEELVPCALAHVMCLMHREVRSGLGATLKLRHLLGGVIQVVLIVIYKCNFRRHSMILFYLNFISISL